MFNHHTTTPIDQYPILRCTNGHLSHAHLAIKKWRAMWDQYVVVERCSSSILNYSFMSAIFDLFGTVFLRSHGAVVCHMPFRRILHRRTVPVACLEYKGSFSCTASVQCLWSGIKAKVIDTMFLPMSYLAGPKLIDIAQMMTEYGDMGTAVPSLMHRGEGLDFFDKAILR